MENKFENHSSASDIMKNDYLNTWLSFLNLSADVEKKYKKINLPKTFSERYPGMTFAGFPFSVSLEEKERIRKIDELTVKAGKLIDDSLSNAYELLKIAIEVANICDNKNFQDSLKKCLLDYEQTNQA